MGARLKREGVGKVMGGEVKRGLRMVTELVALVGR